MRFMILVKADKNTRPAPQSAAPAREAGELSGKPLVDARSAR
jgi:hypothetical protein